MSTNLYDTCPGSKARYLEEKGMERERERERELVSERVRERGGD